MAVLLQSAVMLPLSSAKAVQLNSHAHRLHTQTKLRGTALASVEHAYRGSGDNSKPLAAVAASLALAGAAGTRFQRTVKLSRRASEDVAVVAAKGADTWDLLFENYATWLVGHFDSEVGLKELPLPHSFATRKGQSKANASAEIRTKLFEGQHEGSPIKKLRLTMVCNGSELQALNAVVYPALELGPLPIWGIDILSFNGGKRMLFGLDWSPMSPSKKYADEHIAPYVRGIKNGEHAALASVPSSKIYGEDPEFFSPYMFFARPEGEADIATGSGLWEVFQAYSSQYTKMLRNATVDPMPAHHLRAAEQHAAYERWHAERDPAILVFRRLFGAEWTEEYVRDILFPGSAVCADAEPDVKLSPLELHRAGIFRSESSECPFTSAPAPPNDFCESEA